MRFEVTDVPSMGIRVAVCDQGVELVQVVAEDAPITRVYAGGVLAALSVKVDDIDAVKARLLKRGAKLINEVETYSLREFYCHKDSFHGVPLAVAQYGDSFLEAIHGPGEMPPGYAPKVTWNMPEFGPTGGH
jgi:hypothetical protein